MSRLNTVHDYNQIYAGVGLIKVLSGFIQGDNAHNIYLNLLINLILVFGKYIFLLNIYIRL